MKKSLKEFTEQRVHLALREVIDHLWHEQQQDYLSRQESERKDHLFESVDLVAQWLEHSDELRAHSDRLVCFFGLGVASLALGIYFLPELLKFCLA